MASATTIRPGGLPPAWRPRPKLAPTVVRGCGRPASAASWRVCAGLVDLSHKASLGPRPQWVIRCWLSLARGPVRPARARWRSRADNCAPWRPISQSRNVSTSRLNRVADCSRLRPSLWRNAARRTIVEAGQCCGNAGVRKVGGEQFLHRSLHLQQCNAAPGARQALQRRVHDIRHLHRHATSLPVANA